MLDERIHPAKGRLEGGEPISRLLRNVEENLCDIHDSLLPCCEVTNRQRADQTEGARSTYIDFDLSYSRIPLAFAFETCLRFRLPMGVVVKVTGDRRFQYRGHEAGKSHGALTAGVAPARDSPIHSGLSANG